MIIETTTHEQNGITFRRLTSANNYWGIGYNDDLTVFITAAGTPLMTVPEYEQAEEGEPPIEDPQIIGGWLNGGTVTDSLPNGFGADTFDELWAETKVRGIIFPQDFLDHLATLGFT